MTIRLEDVNAAITEHGYLPLDGDQLGDLQAIAGPDLVAWVIDCARHGREADSWESLRAALYGASAHCAEALAILGYAVDRQRAIRSLLAHRRPLRTAIARAAVQRRARQAVDAGDVALLARAFGDLPARGGLSGETTSAAAAPRKPDPSMLHHVYGRAFAITFECTTGISGRHVLQVEAAARSQRGQGFDWTRKIALQLVDHEVVELLAVLRGVRPEASFGNHGANRDKAMTVREQQQGEQPSIYFNVRRGQDSRTVPVPVFNAFRIEALATRVLLVNEPGLAASDVAQRIDRLARRFGGPTAQAA
jgi:hypothetical protein